MQSLENRIILVTGATDGLGKHVAAELAARGATVLLHGRDREKGNALLQTIASDTGNRNLFYYNADFSSLDAVRRLAGEITAAHERLDVLINNAGTGAGVRGESREKSADGHELRLAVNYLAPFCLTHRLLPLLRRSAAARIVNVASVGQQAIDFDDVILATGYDGLRAYRQSKLALVMFTFALADRLKGSGITVNTLHPATLMNTKMVVETDYFGGPLTTVTQGTQAVLYLAVAPDLDGVTGAYFDGRRRARADAQAYDTQARRQLWTLSEQLTGIKEYGE